MLDHFLINTCLGSIGLAILATPLGCFIVWRRMAFFGDTISHSALLGIALGIFLKIDTFVTILIVSMLIALLLLWTEKFKTIQTDTYLSIASHTSLSLGLILIYILEPGQINLMNFLIGDILSLTRMDLTFIFTACIVSSVIMYKIWHKLIAITLSEEIAQAENIPLYRYKIILLTLLVLMIAFAVKIVGILLITALLVIPVSAARPLSRSPEQMLGFAMLISLFAISLGITGSYYYDTPTGPTIVFSLSLCLVIITASKQTLKQLQK